MNELNHTNGKGDKERSPGWRANYEGIDFHRSTRDGFARRGNRLVKAYGGRVARFTFPEAEQTLGCGATNNAHFICTLDAGHLGNHKAYGATQNLCDEWPQSQALSDYMLEKGIKL